MTRYTPDRWNRHLITALLALAVALPLAAACGGDGGDDPQSPVRGIVTDVRASDSGTVEGVTLESDDGERYEFAVMFEEGAAFDAAHLEEHRRERAPVSISFRGTGDSRVAYRIDDG